MMITQLNQQNQQPSLVSNTLPMASQVQIRQSLALKNIESTSQQLINANQPLSPTNQAIQAANKQQQSEQQKQLSGLNGGKQTELKGIPQIVGLTTVEYSIEDNIQVSIEEFQGQVDLNHFYLSQLYDDKAQDFPFRMLSDLQNPQESYQILKLRIKLATQMTLEHLELHLNQNNFDIFSKYLKFLRVETVNTEQQKQNQQHQRMSNGMHKNHQGFIDKSLQRALSLDSKNSSHLQTISQADYENGLQKLHLKSGFLDSSKKILEMHTCGVSQDINLVFLYSKKSRPNSKTLLEMTEKKKEKLFSKTMNVSEKIKNEILPLLNNGSDEEDIDELDDEVAMISNKQRHTEKQKAKRQNNLTQKIPSDILSHEEIKIEMTGKNNQKQNQQTKPVQNQPVKQSNQQASDKEEDEETRNFNTLPRNYSDPLSKPHLQNTGSYNNDMDFNSQFMNEHANLLPNDIAHLPDSQLQLVSQSEIFNFAEQEIFSIQGPTAIQEMQRLLQKTISSIIITGFNTNSIPAITNMAYFINNSFLLKQKQMLEHSLEYDLLSGVLMITFKKITQAAEIFRKIQTSYLTQIEQLQNQTQQKQNQTLTQKLYLKCAILELLTCESMCQPNQINEKLQSIERMISLYQFKLVPKMTFIPIILNSQDPFSTIKKFLPQLLKFTVLCLTHKKEIVKMSALKLLEFILETKGCSLDQSMVFILKALLNTYPNPLNLQSQQSLPIKHLKDQHINTQTLSLGKSDSFSVNGFTQSIQEFFQYEDYRQLDQNENQQNNDQLNQIDEITKHTSIKEPTSGFINALKSAYNHALETYISVLSSISSHILHQLFYEVIITNIVDKKGISNNLSSQTVSHDMKQFSIKIAEKIITICQGDLFLSKPVLEFFINIIVSKPAVQIGANAQNQSNEQVLNSVKNLWQSIRTKVFTNYSQKGLKILIEWLVDKMSQIAQNAQTAAGQPLLTDSSQANAQDISKLEITDDETQQLLQLFDIVSMISVGRKNNEAEANSLIKIKQEFCLELYVLINPLMFWLDFSVEREERFPLFKAVYGTIKDVLENLPPKKNDIDLLQIMEPILLKTKEFLKNNSPSLQMLKFLEIVLRDMKAMGYSQDNPEIQSFFLEMLDNFVVYISYCLHEEVFSVFDKLFALCSDVMSERVLTKCISAMVDKYTLRNRGHKNSLSIFVKNLLEVNVRQHIRSGMNVNSNQTLGDSEEDIDDQISIRSKNNYFEIVCEFCFFQNVDPFPLTQPVKYREDFKSVQDLHDMYIDKLQFFTDHILPNMTEMHVNLFAKFIQHPQFKPTLLSFLSKGEIQLRLKCHEILEVICGYYIQHCPSKTVYRIQQQNANAQVAGQSQQAQPNEVMEVQYISHERLQLSQVVLECILQSLKEGEQDSYLQFNALILLDFLFQQMLPVPSYQNEMQKERINRGNSNVNNRKGKGYDKVFDLQNEEINDDTPEFEVTASGYTLMRLDLIFKLWPHVQLALNSPWSNIRSICYGLICSMLKVDIQSLAMESFPTNPQIGQQYILKLKQIVIPMLKNLLSSKESESKAGGLNILGSFCGLSYDFSKVKISKNMEFFKKNSSFISNQLWQLVFELQDDWDITIKEASVVLVQLCAPKNAVKYFDKIKKDLQEKRFNQILQGYGIGLNNGEQSSRMSSAREHMHMMQPSMGSNEGDTLMQNIYQNQDQEKTALMLSDINNSSGQPHNNQMFSNTQIFDKIGDTINSNVNGLNRIISPMALSEINDEVREATLDEEIKRFERQDYAKQIQNQTMQSLEDLFEFFVDKYQDDQIQEIISIFRNDFKPPKSLWIEKSSAGPGINQPDYYAEIYSQAIDLFNQQQAQLQQQQQQQQQQMVNNSPKNMNKNSLTILGGGSMIDALEDDMVKKIENERIEKEKQQTTKVSDTNDKDPNQKVENYKIFERHYEDDKEEEEKKEGQTIQTQQPKSLNIDTNIDAEPYQFLEDSPAKVVPLELQTQALSNQAKPATKKAKKSKEEKKKQSQLPQPNLQLQIQEDPKQFQNLLANKSYEKTPIGNQQTNAPATSILSETQKQQQQALSDNQQLPLNQKEEKLRTRKKSLNKDKKTTDELIEEYERKITKTKQKLEEQKRKSKGATNTGDQNNQIYETGDIRVTVAEAAAKSTPEFKQHKKEIGNQNQKNFIFQDDPNIVGSTGQSKSNEKKKNQQQNNNQQFVNELPKNYMSNIDNAKLMKQINNCFNDNSYNNINIGPVVMTTTIGNTVGTTKHKQKLNKSFENILASNKYNLKQTNDLKQAKQKNLSSSPRRGSSSGKKSGNSQVKSAGHINKKKYLDQSYQFNSSKNQQKALQNMRDFNYFIKTIEKDQTDKYKLNLKDFNSMPTTPTSILKKVEDQMKALASSNLGFSKGDIKAQMSNTCPNMAQILSQLDTFGMQGNYSNPPQMKSQSSSSNHNQVLQVSNLKLNGIADKIKYAGGSQASEANMTSNHTPSNFSNHGNNMIMAQSLSGNSLGNQLEKFSFSKTQKLDLKDAAQNLFNYHVPHREGQTARDHSSENRKFKSGLQIQDSQKIRVGKGGNQSKRSRGSQEKYLTGNHQGNATHHLINTNSSGSSSFAKLNKSLNNISNYGGSHSGHGQNSKSKEQLSKSMINNFVKATNISPKDKKLVQQMIKSQLLANPSQATTNIHQTPNTAISNHNNNQNLNNQYSYSSNLLYDYIQSSEHSKKHQTHNQYNSQNNAQGATAIMSHQQKTPVKVQGQNIHVKKQGVTGKIGGGNYSEIFDISPSSGEKDKRQYAKYIL